MPRSCAARASSCARHGLATTLHSGPILCPLCRASSCAVLPDASVLRRRSSYSYGSARHCLGTGPLVCRRGTRCRYYFRVTPTYSENMDSLEYCGAFHGAEVPALGAESSKRAAPPVQCSAVQCSAVQWPHRPLASVHPFAVASRPAAAPRNATRLARAATCVLVSPRPFGFGLCARDGHSTPATLSPQVPFVFGYPNEIRSAPEQRISAAMGCYWSNFIEWGNPNDLDHPVQCAKRLGLPAWPMVGDDGDAMSLSIDASNATVFAVMPQLRKDKCDLYAQYPDSGI